MRFRAPVPDDAPAVLAVLVARDIADLGAIEHALEPLLDEWRGNDLDLDLDAQVVEDEDRRIVAYAAVRRWPGSLVVVDPDSEGRGIGSRLLAWTEDRECVVGRGLHRQWVAAGNASARSLLTGAGYERARSYFRMACSLAGAGPEPPVPSGFRLRSADVARDAAAMHAIDTASFATTPDYMPESLAEFIERNLEAYDFDAGLSRVAMERDRIVGFLLAHRQQAEGVGYVSILAVEPGHQRLGLGTTMLRSVLAAFTGAGLREAQLGVASYNDRGLRLYERVGMTVRHQFDIYERPLAQPPGF